MYPIIQCRNSSIQALEHVSDVEISKSSSDLYGNSSIGVFLCLLQEHQQLVTRNELIQIRCVIPFSPVPDIISETKTKTAKIIPKNYYKDSENSHTSYRVLTRFLPKQSSGRHNRCYNEGLTARL